MGKIGDAIMLEWRDGNTLPVGYRAKCLKEKYLDASRRNKGKEGYSFEMLQALRDMARENVYPDGRFSDEECNVWSMFRTR